METCGSSSRRVGAGLPGRLRKFSSTTRPFRFALHQTFIPPSTTMSTPVTYELSSDAKKQSHVRYVFGASKAAQQSLAEHVACKFGVLELLSSLIGLNQAGRDRIRANAMLSSFHRELTGHSNNSRFGCRMGQGCQILEAHQ